MTLLCKKVHNKHKGLFFLYYFLCHINATSIVKGHEMKYKINIKLDSYPHNCTLHSHTLPICNLL
jgi:hypothetical protein